MAASIGSRRAVGNSVRHGNVDPVGLILPRSNGGIEGLQDRPSAAQRSSVPGSLNGMSG